MDRKSRLARLPSPNSKLPSNSHRLGSSRPGVPTAAPNARTSCGLWALCLAATSAYLYTWQLYCVLGHQLVCSYTPRAHPSPLTIAINQVLLLSARFTPATIAHLLIETSPSCILTSTHTSWLSNEAVSLLRAESNIPHIPDLVNALGYEGLLHGGRDTSKFIAPSKYTAYEPGDLDGIIFHSSGTTGLPKPIYHSQTYLLIVSSCHRLPEQVEPFRSNVSTLPLYHVSVSLYAFQAII